MENAFQIGGGAWNNLQMRRGRKSAARAKDPTQCPQQVRLEWDRGRVSVAASIEPGNTRNRAFLWGGVLGLAISASRASSKKTKQYSDLMIAISRGLDILLAQRRPPEEAGEEWLALEVRYKEQTRKAQDSKLDLSGDFPCHCRRGHSRDCYSKPAMSPLQATGRSMHFTARAVSPASLLSQAIRKSNSHSERLAQPRLCRGCRSRLMR